MFTSLFLALTLTAAAANPQSVSPPLRYQTTWIGNSFGGRDGKWVQDSDQGLWVAPDGTVYTNTMWDEGGREAGVYRNGQVVGEAGHTHGWGYLGGSEVTANSKYFFFSQTMGNEGGHLVDPNTWPAKGKLWYGISRRLRSNIEQAAPFPGGKGGSGDTLKGSLLVVDEVPDGAGTPLSGLAATETRLFVSDPVTDEVRVFDANSMAPLETWSLPRPGRIAAAPDGTIWIVQDAAAGTPARVLHFTPDGHRLPQTITFPFAADPTALCVDRNRLLIADNGPDQDVKRFAPLEKPVLARRFGVAGGVFSSTPGAIGPRRFHDLVGVGADAAGRIYVAEAGSGTTLECYSPSQQRLWRLQGLLFVDNADLDPASETDLYTKYDHFTIDWAKAGGGQGAAYRGFTLDRFRFPEDPRLHTSPNSVWVRRLQGHTLLYMTDMYSSFLQIYRLDRQRDGEVIVPCGCFAKGPNQEGGKLAAWPPHQPPKGEWIWRDTNGNGTFDAGEFDAQPQDAPDLWGWWVDSRGDVWQATTDHGIRHFPLQGLDSHGSPVYSYATMKTTPTPAPFNNLQRAEYHAETDTMYLAGYTAQQPNDHGYWKVIGRVIGCYPHWSAGNRDAAWTRVVSEPPPGSNEARSGQVLIPASFTVAGQYLFTVSVTDAKVRVYRRQTGAFVGSMQPGPPVGGKSGWVDIPYGINVRQRRDGEYDIFVEEDWLGKVILYRWRPSGQIGP